MLNDESVISVKECQKRGIKADDVLGIVVQTPTVGIVVSLDESMLPWGNDKCLITSRYIEIEGLAERCGLEATKMIVETQKNAGLEETAAMWCWDYKKGGKQWYLPCMSELSALILCKEEVNDVCNILNCSPLASAYYWSSTENNANNAWNLNSNGNWNNNNKNNTNYVRSVFAHHNDAVYPKQARSLLSQMTALRKIYRKER